MVESYSLIGPAKIRTLVIPIGKWKRAQFLEKLVLLRKRFEVRLVDVTPTEDATFNPQGFPQGRLMFDFETFLLEEDDMLFLHDFEPYRKTFVVIGLVAQGTLETDTLQELETRFPNAICHNLICFDEPSGLLAPNVFYHPQSSVETIICDIGRKFLEALSLYYSSYKHVTLRSPGAIGGSSILKLSLTRQPASVPAASALTRKISSMEQPNSSSIRRSASLKSLGLTNGYPDQQRAKARQRKILGNFQLLAGRYSDALTSFSEAATTLHKIHDHIWLGSALEGICISMLLLTYLQVTFHIPAIINILCPMRTESRSGSESNSRKSSFSKNAAESPRASISSMPPKMNSLESTDINLASLIRRISERILIHYEASLSHNIEFAPQLIYCEHILRILKFMTSCYNHESLDEIVLRRINADEFELDENEEKYHNQEGLFTKFEIYLHAQRLFELQLKLMDVVSQVKIYTTMALIYQRLKYYRKRSFILRILLVTTASHSESGALQDYCLNADRGLLKDVLDSYGVFRQPEISMKDASVCTWVTLQKSILSLCISIVKRLGDTEMVTELSLIFLQRFSHTITQMEQSQLLMKNIIPNFSKSEKWSYWDPFILRGLEITRLESNEEHLERRTIHTPSDDPSFKDVQVFNPFRQRLINGVTNPIDKAMDKPHEFRIGEGAQFEIVFQNPLKTDLKITHVSFTREDSKYVNFLDDLVQELPFVLGPNSIKTLHAPVSFKKNTELHTISEMDVGVFDLQPYSFRIAIDERFALASEGTDENGRANFGKFVFAVLPDEPKIEFVSSSLRESAFMILDGAKKTFEIKIHNKSLSCPAVFVDVGHITNVETGLKSDYWKKLLPDDLYEVENQLKELQNNCIRIIDKPHILEPNSTAVLQVELDTMGAPFTFKKFEILLDYSSKQTASDSRSFYSKTLKIPFDLTLKRTLEITGLDVVPLPETVEEQSDDIDFVNFFKRESEVGRVDASDYALLLLDLRNSWKDALEFQIGFENFLSSKTTLQTDHTCRTVIPIKKSLLNHKLLQREVPKLVANRQFVNPGISREQLEDIREKFWCREMLIQKLTCTWTVKGHANIHGKVDSRQFLPKVDSRTLDILCPSRKHTLEVKLVASETVVSSGTKVDVKALINSQRPRHTPDEIATFTFLIFDRRTGRLLPKSNSRVIYNGNLTRKVKLAKDSDTGLELLPLDRGEYEIGCSINSRVFNSIPVYIRVE
ncbi:LAMI_0D11012g1_1 [Lachancea mirantina]|uniref:LAMI_0D11012g1_1 n=1 Tax=Lachancea mirantina TaxID=1230905 RepID=A0A1G4JF72_9SACH|nr:LAMI_0D11012g1_1 [Lachancea mirantina]